MSTNGEYKQSFDPESTSRSWLIFADDKIVGQIAQKHTHTHLFLRTSHSFRGGTYMYLGTHTKLHTRLSSSKACSRLTLVLLSLLKERKYWQGADRRGGLGGEVA